jgi:hypothetical protein
VTHQALDINGHCVPLLRLLEAGSETRFKILTGCESLEERRTVGELLGGVRVMTLRATLNKDIFALLAKRCV